MPRLSPLVGLLILSVGAIAFGSDVPKGMKDVYKINAEKPFHPYWPPIFGQSLLGTIVDAKNPSKPDAIFETIESPKYRSVGYSTAFETSSYALPGVNSGQTTTLGVDAAFTQLDALSNGVKAGGKATNLQGNDTTVANRTNCADTTSTDGVTSPSTTSTTPSATGATSPSTPQASNKGSSSPGASGQNNSQGGCSDRSVTGVDFGHFTNAKVTVPKRYVLFYTRDMLLKMADAGPNGALSQAGRDALSQTENGWIISRCLVADSITYELTSNTAIDGGFFAKLLSWLPTASVRYKNDHTVTISTTSPVVLGYKLWRPGTSLVSSSVQHDDFSKDADEIDTIFAGTAK